MDPRLMTQKVSWFEFSALDSRSLSLGGEACA
jgi:hypothetical protein